MWKFVVQSVLSYWKEAVSCERDRRQGFSFNLFNGFSLSLQSTDKDMASIAKILDKNVY